MHLDNKYLTSLLTLLVFIIFFSYYYVTSNILPVGAGPDWKSNTDATKFIYDHGRLAVLPDDEDKLHFTVYGGTRSLRPPLSYIVSAATAKIFNSAELSPHILFRKGSALLTSLALTLTFYALSIYFSSYAIGILGTVIIGLMPQFTFIASYNNDDSGAVFSATLMIAVLVRIYRYGVSNTNAVLIGLAAGLIVLSKMSAWLLMPTVILFLILFIRAPAHLLLRYTGIAGVIFILAGGWWFAFNISHYGIDDPLAKKITNEVVEHHRRLPDDAGVGFAAQGIGFYELLGENYKNFLGETAKSTIGNLDWLKLRVGPLQYTAYLAVFFIALFYYFFRLSEKLFRRVRGQTVEAEDSRQFIFESLLALIIIFQIIMYTWTNIYNDIQIQGKYILPVFLTILILFFSGILRVPALAAGMNQWLSTRGNIVNTVASRKFAGLSAGLLFFAYVHLNAWTDYVIPFYQPPAYVIKLGEFEAFPLSMEMHQTSAGLAIQKLENGIQYRSSESDPKVIFKNDICRKISTNTMLRLEFFAKNAGALQFFIDENGGFTTKNSSTAKYKQGNNTILLPVSADKCQRLRFDPFTNEGMIILKKFELAPMKISPRRAN